MPRRKALESQVKQINRMFSNPHMIEVSQPCHLHNRKGSIDIYKLGKKNSLDAVDFCGTDRLNSPAAVQRRAKSVDHTGVRKQQRSNRNSIHSTSDLFPNYTVIKEETVTTPNNRNRRSSYFDGMEHPTDFPSMLRNFQSALSLGGATAGTALKTKGDTNNNSRPSISPEKQATDVDSYLRNKPPKRLSFDIDSHTIPTNTNRKLSTSSADSLEYSRSSPSRRYSSHSFGSNTSSPKYFDSADFEKEVSASKNISLMKFCQKEMRTRNHDLVFPFRQ